MLMEIVVPTSPEPVAGVLLDAAIETAREVERYKIDFCATPKIARLLLEIIQLSIIVSEHLSFSTEYTQGGSSFCACVYEIAARFDAIQFVARSGKSCQCRPCPKGRGTTWFNPNADC